LPSPYNYYFDKGSKTYNFTTKNSTEYKIAFIVDETFSAISGLEINNIYQIIIEKVSDEIEKFDGLVAETIKNIIKVFFENSENAMIYICNDFDKKAISRFNAFERWYWNSDMTNYISKIDNVIKCNLPDNQIQIIYTSLLFHKDNTNKETIIEIYNTIEEILNNDK
jgi:hypothetical protein